MVSDERRVSIWNTLCIYHCMKIDRLVEIYKVSRRTIRYDSEYILDVSNCNSARQRRLCQNPGRLESAAKGDYARSDSVPDFAAASLRGKREAKTVGYYLSVAGQ